jgi:NAD+ synthase (glutamine-hydrolysing)
VKIALSQLNYHIGNFEGNVAGIIHAIRGAREKGADLVVFAELSISGYPPRDFLEFEDFIDKCYEGIEKIAGECKGIAAIIGAPSRNRTGKGKPLYNSAFFLSEGRIEEIVHKTLLPNYDIFDEYRYFEPNRDFRILEYKGVKMAVTICEDLWNIGENPLYVKNPMEELSNGNPDIIINIAASPFHYKQAAIRKEVYRENARKYGMPVVYVNHVGAQTELLFDGGSFVMNNKGSVIRELKYFDEDLAMVEASEIIKNDQEAKEIRPVEKIPVIHDALVMGIRNYFRKLGFDRAILGLSGGIDSAVTLVLAARALGAGNVKAVLMPSGFSSLHSVKDALELAHNLGCPYEVINIEQNYHSFLHSLSEQLKGKTFDITEENLQARIRGVILMALSNREGSILLNTSNKSEAAVGYSTLYGDMNGGLSVLGDVYKTDVFALARYINRNEGVIPENSITKPPSAELRPDQKDSDSLPDYEVLDNILIQYIEQRKGPREIIDSGYPKELVDKVLWLVNLNEYKRFQTPPILRVSPKAFGMGRRMPIVARYLA